MVGLQYANHGDMIISSPPSHNCNRENAHAGHIQGVSRGAKVPCTEYKVSVRQGARRCSAHEGAMHGARVGSECTMRSIMCARDGGF